MFHWLHHLLNPHCPECRSDRQEESICQTCEVLTVQLARSNVDKDNLLSQIERMANPPILEETPSEIPEPLKPRVTPWPVKKAMLEAEDRVAANLLRKASELDKIDKKETEQSIEDLEKEVGIPDGN